MYLTEYTKFNNELIFGHKAIKTALDSDHLVASAAFVRQKLFVS